MGSSMMRHSKTVLMADDDLEIASSPRMPGKNPVIPIPSDLFETAQSCWTICITGGSSLTPMTIHCQAWSNLHLEMRIRHGMYHLMK